MTLDEVMQLQREMKTRGASTGAVGRYQIVGRTLDRLKGAMGLTGGEKFTPDLQDRLARELLHIRGYDDFVRGKISAAEFQKSLSQEWSSFPENANNKIYSKYGNARARVRSEDVQAAALAAKAEHDRYIRESPYVQQRLDDGYMPSMTRWR